MPGYVFGDGYAELQSNAMLYVQATEVGGTHPALLEAMGRGAAIAANDVPEHREVLGEAGVYYARNDPAALGAVLGRLVPDGDERARLGEAARARAMAEFSWGSVTDRYERLFERMRGTTQAATGWGEVELTIYPPSHRRAPRRADGRRRDHGGGVVHRPVDRPVRSRRLGGDVGDCRGRRCSPRSSRGRRRRRPVDPGVDGCASDGRHDARPSTSCPPSCSWRSSSSPSSSCSSCPTSAACSCCCCSRPRPSSRSRPARRSASSFSASRPWLQHPLRPCRRGEPGGGLVRRRDRPPHRARASADRPPRRTGRPRGGQRPRSAAAGPGRPR